MKKFDVTIWYSLPKWACFTIEAETYNEARQIAQKRLLNEDTSTWNDASDADIEVEVEESK